MKYTSAEAAKLQRKLFDEHNALTEQEEQRREFLASLGETVEDVRPEYHYAETQEKLAEIEAKIRKIKHAVNAFNVSHVVPGFDMTVDEVLVYIPQLSQRKQKLLAMKRKLPKARENVSPYGRSSSVVDYRYTNYDIADAERDYDAVADELSRLQLALDLLNNTETMEIDL